MVIDLPTEFPSTPAEIFDHLQERFGLGDYDEETSTIPHWKWRQVEISKLKSMMKRRRVNERELAISAWYARAQGTPITATWQLFESVRDALAAYRKAGRDVPTDVRNQLSAAAEEAHALGEAGWAARLYAADDKSGPPVLEQWRNRS